MAESVIPDKQTLALRHLLFATIHSKAQLQNWTRVFLGLDFPDVTVSEESNSNPLEFIWDCYDRLRRNDLKGFSRAMAYAGRFSFKTLGVSVLEVLTVLQLGRNIAHMAATLEQSQVSQEYIKQFFNIATIHEFVTTQAEKQVRVVRYQHQVTGVNLPKNSWKALPAQERQNYNRFENYIKLVSCTMAGANCVDPSTFVTLDDGSQIHASDVHIGDTVQSFHTGKQEWVPSRVSGVSYTLKQSCRLIFSNGGTVVVSEDHPVLCSDGWRRARTLKKYHGFWLLGKRAEEEVVNVDDFPVGYLSPSMVLLGTLLGDSSLVWPAKNGKRYGKGPRLTVFHSRKQTELLDNVAAALRELGIGSKKTPSKNGHILCSQVSEKLVGLYNEFYGSGKKVVTQTILDRVDLTAMATWFMDDGSGGPEDIGSAKNKPISLATCGFSQDENQLIAAWLRTRWGLKSASVGKVSNQSKRVYPIVSVSADDSRRFSELVWDYVLPCCRYKLWEPVGFLDGFCIESGKELPPTASSGNGFRREKLSLTREGQRAWRKKWQGFSRLFDGKLVRVEPLGSRVMCDLILDAPDAQRNFIGNDLILLHNSKHTELMVIDEVDVIEAGKVRAYRQAQNIPTARNGMLPLTLLVSTRKSRKGLVQAEIDKASESGLQVRHWNLIDVTESCKPDRHHPELPKETYYVNDDLVKHVTAPDYEILNEAEKKKYYPVEGFAGCRGCRLFPACKGRLATHQTSTSKLLKPIEEIIGKFQSANTPDFISTEYLCRKPDTSGLIYPRFNKEVHMKTAAEMAEMVSGEPQPQIRDKADLISFLKAKGVKFAAGMDFGFTHNFAVVTGGALGSYCLILDVYAQAGLELDDKVMASEYLKTTYDNPPVWPDMAYPADIKTFKRRGFRLRDWEKNAGSVKAGIEIVRAMLWDARGRTRLYFLKGDPYIDMLVDRLEKYGFMVDAAGNPSDVPDEKDDDELDALRYYVMNYFGRQGAMKDTSAATTSLVQTALSNSVQQPWMQTLISQATGGQALNPQAPAPTKVRKGRFFFSS